MPAAYGVFDASRDGLEIAMAVEVHVEGRVAAGRLPEFGGAVERYKAYAGENGYAVPEVLLGLSGPMNTVRLVYRYEDLSTYDEHEFRAMKDVEYGKVADSMGLVDGTIVYSVYHQI
ncbi:MAG TPA: hypothetical protein VFY84_13890 [Jiangellales bacterium]|nr:hypothetical protein [Jiangellales bacterium]